MFIRKRVRNTFSMKAFLKLMLTLNIILSLHNLLTKEEEGYIKPFILKVIFFREIAQLASLISLTFSLTKVTE